MICVSYDPAKLARGMSPLAKWTIIFSLLICFFLIRIRQRLWRVLINVILD